MAKITKEDALRYHFEGRPGKLEVVTTKPHTTQRDLSLAYSPGVAFPCLEINKNFDDIYKYTSKGNLVAVISNGTAVLGLGDIGAGAGKPVMEGKGFLFKIFADIDVFDIEVDTKDIDQFVETVKNIAVTFGGINLEDIKAPECFEIEERLKRELQIPLMHDDQHGTAIISSAGIINSLELSGKKLSEAKLVINGAGASAIACTKLIVSLGAKRENIVMLDSKGALRKDRTDLNKYKIEFATGRDVRTLADALNGADIFLGLSQANVVTKEMVRSMAKNPIVFAMANPDPEISYDEAMSSRDDLIMATGRSDYPNQVNNVLGFPYIFRGALDVRATCINEEMKLAAVYALAGLAKEVVPESVSKAYNVQNLIFGKDYIIPKPLDPRLLTTVAPAVAKAAMDSGVARNPIKDWNQYKLELSQRLGLDNQLFHGIETKAKQNPKRIVFAEGNNLKILRAANEVLHEGIAIPILLGNVEEIKQLIADNHLDLNGTSIFDPHSMVSNEMRRTFADLIWKKRQRKGVNLEEAYELTFNRNYFGIMMVDTGLADAMISGVTSHYGDVMSPALRLIGPRPNINHISSMYIIMTKRGPLFFADTTVNLDPDTQTLIETTLLTADQVKKFNIEPVIAMVSYSNFGSVPSSEHTRTLDRVRQSVAYLHQNHPELIVDGEIQMNFALNKELRSQKFPFTRLENRDVNTIIFPNLTSGNIAYKMMYEIGGAEVVGPILMGMNKPILVVPTECSVRDIVNMTTIAVVDAQ
ncbi:MAG: NADP-dependent malic enzyme [Bacteroidota bacterium]|nr:NADP-dependent malic enzyme [Odoribacter sp.]MDP3643273.1 NADP-dependent malic enzyme [Bacteroidota bacterium]